MAEKLVRLSSGGVSTARPDEDIRGWRVVDRTETQVGTVDDLFVDGKGRPHVILVEVESGEKRSHLVIPANTVRLTPENTVWVGEFKSRILEAPEYDAERHDVDALAELYDFYGVSPDYAPGYGAG